MKPLSAGRPTDDRVMIRKKGEDRHHRGEAAELGDHLVCRRS